MQFLLGMASFFFLIGSFWEKVVGCITGVRAHVKNNQFLLFTKMLYVFKKKLLKNNHYVKNFFFSFAKMRSYFHPAQNWNCTFKTCYIRQEIQEKQACPNTPNLNEAND